MVKCHYCKKDNATEFFKNYELRSSIAVCIECMITSKIAVVDNGYWKVSEEAF